MTERLDALTSWHEDWTGLRVAVLGLGVTGFSVADTLMELGVTTTVFSEQTDLASASAMESVEREDLLTVIGAGLYQPSVGQTLKGAAATAALANFRPDLLVVSPGFAPNHELVLWARDNAVTAWGDVELAWRLRDKVTRQNASGKLVAAEWFTVTGTNGKTTTVRLATAMFAAAGHRVIACGNVGVPILDAIRDPQGYDALVVELSSFQLHYTHTVSAHSSVCLNLADDHLDWHGGADSYAAAKAKVYANTRISCVFNRDDAVTRTMVEDAEVVEGCRAIGFGLAVPGPSDFGVVSDYLLDRAFLAERHTGAIEITSVEQLAAVGLDAPHLVSDVLAAAALARSFDVSPERIRHALASFRIDNHRLQTVATVGKISWVDDSKATNPHAARAALASFESVVWIVGGLFKGVDLGQTIEFALPRLRAVVLIGLERSELRDLFARHAPQTPVLEVASNDTGEVMVSAVRLAASLARSGDTVLLAPAAASMDQFIDYADRGRQFTAAVRNLLGVESHGQAQPSEAPTSTDE